MTSSCLLGKTLTSLVWLVLFLFCTDGTYDEAYMTGMCSLLHLLINSCQSFKSYLQADDLLASVVVSLKEHFSKSEVCSFEEVCKTVTYMLKCKQNRSTTVSYHH